MFSFHNGCAFLLASFVVPILAAQTIAQSPSSEFTSPMGKALEESFSICQSEFDSNNLASARISCQKARELAGQFPARSAERPQARKILDKTKNIYSQIEDQERSLLPKLREARTLFREDRLAEARQALNSVKSYTADARFQAIDNDLMRREEAIDAAKKPRKDGPASVLYLAIDYFRTCKTNFDEKDFKQAKKDCDRAKDLISSSKFNAGDASQAGNLKAEINIKLLDIKNSSKP